MGKKNTRILRGTKIKTKSAKPRKAAIFYVGLSFLALLVSLLIVYIVFAALYQSKILPRTSVLNLKVGDETALQATQEIESINQNLKNYQTEIAVDDKSVKFTANELGLTVNAQKTAQKAFSGGRYRGIALPHKVFQALFLGIKISPVYELDENKLKSIVKEKFPDTGKEPINASLTVENNVLKTTAGEAGTQIDFAKIKSILWESLKNNRLPNKIAVSVVPTEPEISLQDVEKFKPEAEKFGQNTFTLNVEEKGAFTASGGALMKFIDFAESIRQQKIVLGQEGINEFLDTVGKKVNKYATDRKITRSGEVLEEGEEGLILDKDQALQAIITAIPSGRWEAAAKMKIDEIEEKTVISSDFSGGGTPGLYPGKYIELNLSTQTLYCFEGENEICAYRVSTGKWSMPTPTGTFAINSKTEMAYSATYGLYMPWWMSFIGNDYGIHELPEWPGGAKEGEGHLGTPVSHGCVRLGVGAAESVYSWAEIGTPVVVHY